MFSLIRVVLAIVVCSVSDVSVALDWTTAAQPVTPWTQYHEMHGAAFLNGYLYVIGGRVASGNPPQGSASTDSFSAWYAGVLSPGSIGEWTTCTATLPAGATPTEPDYAHICRHVNTYGGRIYITGGNSNRVPADPERNSVTWAQPNPAGDITTWYVTPVAGTAISRYEHTSVIDQTQGRIYVLGGGSSSPVTEVNTAPINADGSPATFATASSLSVGVRRAPAVILNNRLYVLGGESYSGAISVVQHATILPGGSLGSFSATADAQLPEARFDAVAAALDGTIYYVAGTTSGDANTRNSVYRAVVDSSGNITSWQTDNPIPVLPGLRRTACAGDSSGIYIPGGRLDATQLTGQVWFALSETSISEWRDFGSKSD